ncbi:hypothetical protein CEUSTIGMA_g5688.t1 [Chlamydomonas eustigma]|uniref:Calponin-homology (CH) domain-containing protein n=1 Tax=Chlamydomonas eustigma TaxID=1157962 RepID=A0A250X5C3_9CHLO|nr:hypothetical protein CEUSTIGMA_g5688.t1 [Chlamydomonas eustigma]|eukprot:GAX78246.1 hypothetical protein CEUSTIGMA_g5688.t1 [Chlamydomonas eustigma]
MDVSEAELQGLYTWVDEIPLSRPKRNIGRDFSDGVLMAEIVHHYFPKLVELHNYSSANGTQQKMYNWNTLNQKVLKRLGFFIPKEDVMAMCNCQPGAVERTLKLVKMKISKLREDGFNGSTMMQTAQADNVMSPVHPQPHVGGPPRGQQQQQQLRAVLDAGVLPAAHPHQQLGAAGAFMPQGQSRFQAGGGNSPGADGTGPLLETISELKETNEILETKVRKLEQLVRLKDAKIQTLMAKLGAAGLT